MKRITRISVLSASIAGLLVAVAFAGTVFSDMNVRESGGQVVVQWTTADETGCLGFIVERSTDGVDFVALNSQMIPARAARSYEYTDPYVFKQTAKTFTYRVKAVLQRDRSEYSPVRTVYITMSGIQQTWGGLKALFR